MTRSTLTLPLGLTLILVTASLDCGGSGTGGTAGTNGGGTAGTNGGGTAGTNGGGTAGTNGGGTAGTNGGGTAGTNGGGTAGTNGGGTAGTGGTTGRGGAQGDAGTVGTGGRGGNAGSGGTVGTAGRGGSLGTSGTDGNGGRGGAAGGTAGSGGRGGMNGNGGRGGMNGTGGRGGGAGGSGGGTSGGLTVTSTAFTEGMMIPAVSTCTGNSHMSPPLAWTAGPTGTMSYGVALVDMTNGLVHWALWDVPSTTMSLPAALPTTQVLTTPIMGKQVNQFTGDGYFGPCPNGTTHIYVFEVYALDVATLPGLTATSTTTAVRNAMIMHDLASGTLSGMSNASMN